MPTVRGGSNTPHSGYHNKSEIKKTMNEAIARDDLDHKFAGEDNKGPAANEKTTTRHDTHVKNRKADNSGPDQSEN